MTPAEEMRAHLEHDRQNLPLMCLSHIAKHDMTCRSKQRYCYVYILYIHFIGSVKVMSMVWLSEVCPDSLANELANAEKKMFVVNFVIIITLCCR